VNWTSGNTEDPPIKNINLRPKMELHMRENHIRMLEGAKKIGVKIENIGAEDILRGVQHLCLGIIWQIIKLGLLKGAKQGAKSEKEQLMGKNDSFFSFLSFFFLVFFFFYEGRDPVRKIMRWIFKLNTS